MFTPLAVAFIINIATSALKKVIFPRFGKTGVQTIVFICALVGAFYLTYVDQFPSIKVILVQAATLFSIAVAFYEVILSRLGIFSSNKK